MRLGRCPAFQTRTAVEYSVSTDMLGRVVEKGLGQRLRIS